MSVQIRWRGDTTAAHKGFIGADREITIDTDKRAIVVHDGETLGGFPMAREDLKNVARDTIAGRGIAKDDLSNAANLVGFVFPSPLGSASGFLRCDGSAVSRAAYATLFARIGTTFGAGDGSTTFNLPDYRGCFLRGAGGNSAAIGTKQEDGAPNITGEVNPGAWFEALQAGQTGAFYAIGGNRGYRENNGNYQGGVVGFNASRSSAVYGRAGEVRPINHAINFFIKY